MSQATGVAPTGHSAVPESPPRRRPRLGPLGVAAVVTLLVLASVAVVGYRAFRPHDSLTRPVVSYPAEAVTITDERPFSELRAAPLVIEGRLRVYAETWRVWADTPVGGQYETTPYWAYRRWPAEVVGVVSVSTPAGPLVVSQWSDGRLIALAARTGEIAWSVTVPVTQDHYDGRRTGAATVYDPHSLRTVSVGGTTLIIVTSAGGVRAVESTAGAVGWTWSVPGGCEPAAWTGAGLVAVPACDGPGLTLLSAGDGSPRGSWSPPAAAPPSPGPAASTPPPGQRPAAGSSPAVPAPDLCGLGRSECRLVTANGRAWLLHPDGTLALVPPIEAGSVLAGDRVVYPTPTGVAARRITDGTALWSWNGSGTLLTADSIGVYLLTPDRTVLGLSPVTGHLALLGCASSSPHDDWALGHIYPTGSSYLALERITTAPPASKDSVYFYGARPVALVELYPPTKLPVWPGKFAACAPVNR